MVITNQTRVCSREALVLRCVRPRHEMNQYLVGVTSDVIHQALQPAQLSDPVDRQEAVSVVHGHGTECAVVRILERQSSESATDSDFNLCHFDT